MKTERLIPAGIFVVTTILLSITSYPAIGWWNSGECALAANNLSIPVPGGSILHMLLGRVGVILLPYLPPIKAITLISIFSTALTAVFLYYIIWRFLSLTRASESVLAMIAASAAALAVPFLYSVWQEAGVSRMYSLGLALTAVIVYCGFRVWTAENDNEKIRFFLLLALLLGFDFVAHRLNTPFLPVVILLLFMPLRRFLIRPWFWLLSAFLYTLGFSLHLIIYYRSQLHPLLAFADTSSISDLYSWIRMEQYGSGSNFLELFSRKAPLWEYQIRHMYLRYAGWNLLGTIGNGIPNAAPLLVGIAGILFHARKHLRSFIYVVTCFLSYSIVLVLYLNVQEGFHEIREIDRLFLPSFFIFMIWTGAGLYWLSYILLQFGTRFGMRRSLLHSSILIAAIVILPGSVIVKNWHSCDRSSFTFPRDIARSIFQSCDENAVLFTSGDNDTYPLWYMQYVEGFRRDVCVVNLHLMNLKSFVHQILREPFSFPADSAFIEEYDFNPVSKPDSVYIVPVSASQDTLAPDSLTLIHPGMVINGKNVHFARDIVLLNFLKTNKGKRPVYCTLFTPDVLIGGLAQYLTTEGLVKKFIPSGRVPMNVEKVRENLTSVYVYDNFADRAVVIDESTRNLYSNYRIVFCDMIRLYIQSGDFDQVERMFALMEKNLPRWRFTDSQNEAIVGLEEELHRNRQ